MDATEKEIFEGPSISKSLIKLAVPTILGQIIVVIYNMADTFFIGKTNSNVMITAVTVCMPAFMFLSAIANLFGVGGSSVISRALGKSNTDRASYTCAFSFWGCALVSLIYSLCVLLFINPFVDFLGGSNPEVHILAREYLIWTVVIGGFVTSMNALLAHLIRSEGNASKASIGVIAGGVLNIILDPIFMFVILEPGREVLGAALATMISNAVSFIYYLVIIAKGKAKGSVVSLKLTKHSFEWKIPSSVLSAGIPACVMTLAENISYSILDNLLSAYGTAVQAGIGVAKKINMLAHSAVRGLTQGALPLLGYSYSAGMRKRTKKIALTTAIYAVGIATICMGIMLVFTNSLMNIFIQKENEALTIGSHFLRILCIGGPFSALAYTFISFFQAVGHGDTSLVLALLRKGVLDIPLMFILRHFASKDGIVAATPIVDIICCIVAIVLFVTFTHKHLFKDKKRKVYNKETGLYDIVEEAGTND